MSKKNIEKVEETVEEAVEETVEEKTESGYLSPNEVEQLFSVEVLERTKYVFRAENRKDAIQMVKDNTFDMRGGEVLKKVPQTRTIQTVGYRLKNVG
jgi:hypothetical protein